MSSISFNIGLSLLSRNIRNHKTEARRETALRVLSLLEDKPITDNDVLKEENGRPYFIHGDKSADFNISHSGNMVAVSYVRGEKVRTGCDIQLVKERVNTKLIAEQFFHPAEIEYILSQEEQGNNSAFFEIWALKESYIKLYGLSVLDMAQIPSFCKDNKIYCIHPLSFYLYKLNDKTGAQYILAATVNKDSKAPQIRWFSEHSLPCKRIDIF